MTDFILYLTLLCILLPIYVYIIYPLILIILNQAKNHNTINKAVIRPTVSLLISCYNEENVIEKKINNCLSLDYPKDKLHIIFISDGSDDKTDQIIASFKNEGIELIRQEGRLGKTSGINLTIPTTQSELVVFSDANAIYAPDAISKLVQNFNDPRVGYAVGAALYTDGEDTSAAKSEHNYWEYEIFIKKMESSLHSVVGGDGAIYAIRRELYEPLDAEDINDFVNPLQIILKGYRGIFETEAQCFEETAGNFAKEANRKIRIVNRSFRGLMKTKSVMNPFKTGIFSFMLISHKLLRWLIPFFLMLFGLGSVYLSYQGFLLFQLTLLLTLVFLWLASFGYFKSTKSNISPIFSYPYYFLLMNIASSIGVIRALNGNVQITWESARIQKHIGLNQTFNYTIGILLLFSFVLFYETIINLIFNITKL